MNVWKKIALIIGRNQNLYLLTVVQSKGSAPGRCGFKMIVTETGELFGSIGGGVMEFNMVEKAKSFLKNGYADNIIVEQVHRGDENSSSGMICSGSQVIAFNYLTINDKVLISTFIEFAQMLEFSANGIKSIEIKHNLHHYFSLEFKNSWCYRELINKKNKAHIFGAGHVSLPTSELLSKIGYDVFLYDNRDNINTFDDNSNAVSKKVIEYTDIFSQISIHENDYVLLMTHKFTEDKLLLSQLLNKNVNYLGVLGSDNKVKIMFDSLIKDGFCVKQLQKINAPIGLSIKSQTTNEIAISIVAEIIKLKNS